MSHPYTNALHPGDSFHCNYTHHNYEIMKGTHGNLYVKDIGNQKTGHFEQNYANHKSYLGFDPYAIK